MIDKSQERTPKQIQYHRSPVPPHTLPTYRRTPKPRDTAASIANPNLASLPTAPLVALVVPEALAAEDEAVEVEALAADWKAAKLLAEVSLELMAKTIPLAQ